MRATRVLAVLAMIPVLSLAACGDGNGTDDFIADADEICTDVSRESTQIQTELGPPQSADEEATLIEKVIPTRHDRLNRLEDLDAPDEVTDDFEEYISVNEQILDNDEKSVEALRKGDTDAAGQLGAEYQDLLDERQKVGGRIGFEACAERLPANVENEVKSEIELTFTTGDPAFCTEHYTENFVQTAIGSVAECKKSESEPGGAAKSIEFKDIDGVEGVFASVQFVPRGGPNSGQPGEAYLVYEDGIYKREAVFAAPPE